jgi:branched-chain amino acid transport system substrate-binding protein
MNRLWIGIAALVALAAVAYFVFNKPQNTDAVRIGVVLPLSGSMAEYGDNGRNGLTLAQEELARDPAMRGIELIYQDSGDTPEGSVTAVRRLIDVEGVQYIIGGLTSSGTLAAAPYAQERGVLFFTPAASAPGIPEIGDMVFRNWPADDTIARAYGTWAYGQGARNIALLAVSNDYGTTNADGFAATFTAAGGQIALRRSFAQGATDFRALVAQVANTAGVDRVVVIGYPDEYRAFFQQLRSSRISPSSVLASDTFYSPDVVAEFGALVEGVTVAVASKPGDDYEPRRTFTEAYRNRFQTTAGEPRDPGLVSDTAYDALKLIVQAISGTDGSPAAVAQYLSRVRDYQGAAGPTTFTEEGDVPGELAVYRVSSGAFVEQE